METTAQAVKHGVTAGIYAGQAVDPSTLPIASPWASSDLTRVMWADMFGDAAHPPNTRAAAMSIPAVARGRNLLVTSIARLPIEQLRGSDRSPVQPSWIMKTSDGVSPQHRNAWTVDDLIFYGWSCWTMRRGADGFPLTANRVPQDCWEIDQDSLGVVVNGARDPEAVLIPGFHEGILAYGQGAIADTLGIYRAVRDRISSPVPPIDLHQVDGADLTPAEIDALVARWVTARQSGKGAVGYTSRHIEARILDTGGSDNLMIEARNAAAVDLARVIGVSGSRVDATTAQASLTYETTTGRNREFLDLDLTLYTLPLEARLSMDDVTPAGRRIALNTAELTTLTPGPTGPGLDD